jgi:hypothetical protein
MRLSRGETEVYKIGGGIVKVTGYWDNHEIVECLVEVGKRVGGKFAGQQISIAAGEVATWLSLSFPATQEEHGFYKDGQYY